MSATQLPMQLLQVAEGVSRDEMGEGVPQSIKTVVKGDSRQRTGFSQRKINIGSIGVSWFYMARV